VQHFVLHQHIDGGGKSLVMLVFVFVFVLVFVLALFCSALSSPGGGGGKPLIVAVVTKAGVRTKLSPAVLSSTTQPIPFVPDQVIVFSYTVFSHYSLSKKQLIEDVLFLESVHYGPYQQNVHWRPEVYLQVS